MSDSGSRELTNKRLVKLIEQYPIIWNLNYKVRDRSSIYDAWTKIGQQLEEEGISVDLKFLKSRWRNIKDTYRKELKKFESLKEIDENVKEPLWTLFKPLSFLRKQILKSTKERERSSLVFNMTDSEREDNDGIDTLEENILYFEEPQAPQIKQSSSTSDMAEVAEAIQVKRREKFEIQRDDNASDDYHFLMSLLTEMKKFTPAQKFRVRNKINEVMLQEIEDNW